MPGLADILAEKGSADSGGDKAEGGDSKSLAAASMKACWEACKKGDFETAAYHCHDAMEHCDEEYGDDMGGDSAEMGGGGSYGGGGGKPKGVVIAIGHPKG